MLTQFLFAVCMLAVVIVGLLVMTQMISLETLGSGIWRCFLIVVVVIIVLWILKGLLLPMLFSWLVGLKQMFLWIAIFGLALVIGLLVLRMLIPQLTRRSSAHGDRD